MNDKIGVQIKELNLKVDGKTLDLSNNKTFIKLTTGSKLQVSKKMKEVKDDLVVLKNGENLEILYSDGSSLMLEGFYSLENVSIELPTAENEIHILSSNFENSNDTSIVYTQGDMNFFNSLFKDNNSLVKALNEYNHSLETGLNAGDAASASQAASAGLFSGISTTALVIGGVLLTGGIVALASGGGGSSEESSDDDKPAAPVYKKGQLVDSFVAGVDYYLNGSTTPAGKTGADGSFTFRPGDVVTFKVAGITIGSNINVPSDGIVLIQDLVGVDRSEVTNPEVVKIAQFLQTLDSDGNATNGITITNTTLDYLETVIGTPVIGDLNLNAVFKNTVTIVTSEDAIAHLNETMIDGEYVEDFDTVAPTATITLTDSALKIGETSTVTITFSEEVSGFSLADLTSPNGVLSNLVQDSVDSKKYTVTFTPTTTIEDATNVISLANTYTDVAGNTGTVASSANYVIDTLAPTAPTALNLATADDLGASDTDNYTSQTTGLTIDGIGETGSLVQLYTWIDANTDTIIDDSELTTLGSSVSVTGGTFSTDVTLAHSATDYKIVAKQTDAAGNVSATSTALTVAVNTTVPTAVLGTTVKFYESASVSTESYIEITGGSNLTTLVDSNHGVVNVDGSLNYTDFKNQFDFSKMTWTSGASTITFENTDIEKVEIRLDSTLRIYFTASGAGKWADMTTANASTLLNADNTLDSLTIADNFFSTVYGVTDSDSTADMLTNPISSSFTTTPDGTSPTIFSDTIILNGAGTFSGDNIQGSVTVIQSGGLGIGDEQTLSYLDAISGNGYIQNDNTTGLLSIDLTGSTITSGGILNDGGGNLQVDLFSGNITDLITSGNMLIAFDDTANGSSVILDAGIQQLQVLSLSSTNVEFSGFNSSEGDRINLWTDIFAGIDPTNNILNSDEFYSAAGATSGNDATDRIIYNETDGSLYYDEDGSGAGAAIKLMVLTDTPTLTATDFYVHTEVI